MLLHYLDLQRHDSMYVFLLPCMYFLFHAILHFQGKRLVWMRTLSLCIYIIHPMMIIAVRLLAKVAHLQNLLIENSMLHKQGVSIKAHLKIDTGMHRLGISSDDLTDVEKVFSLKHITVCGIYTHLCCSDSLEANDVAFTCEQIRETIF